MPYQRIARAANALRNIHIKPNFLPYADGSVLITCGNTQVICTATVDENVPPFLRGKNQGWVTAEYGMLPASTQSRMKREAAAGKQSGRTQEIQRLIGRSLRAGVDLAKLGERQILIDCDVIRADGGTRTTSITGAFVALQIAVQKLLDNGTLAENPIIGNIAAVSVGMVGGVPLLDLDYPEDSGCDSDVNIVMLDADKIVEIQGTAEGEAFSLNALRKLLMLAHQGIATLTKIQQQAFQAAFPEKTPVSEKIEKQPGNPVPEEKNETDKTASVIELKDEKQPENPISNGNPTLQDPVPDLEIEWESEMGLVHPASIVAAKPESEAAPPAAEPEATPSAKPNWQSGLGLGWGTPPAMHRHFGELAQTQNTTQKQPENAESENSENPTGEQS